MIQVSLIVPCYNEETNIQKGVIDKIGNFTRRDRRFNEVLIVDDGSTDDSRNIIKEKYLKIFPKLRLIENDHGGKARAVIEGIQQAQSPYVLFMDIDLATPVEESEKLIEQIKNGYDIIIGSRKAARKGAPLPRKIMAFGMVVVRDLIIGLNGIKDTQCGFKLFKTKAACDAIKRLQVFKNKETIKGSSVSAAFDLEFLYVCSKLGYDIKEIPVTWRHVETKNVNFVKDTFETLWDILRIKYYDAKGVYTE